MVTMETTAIIPVRPSVGKCTQRHREAAKLQILAPFFLPGSSWGLWLEAHRVKMKHFWVKGLSRALRKVYKLLKITVTFIVSIWKPSVTGGIMVYSSHRIVCFSVGCISCTDMCFCMKVHDQNTHKPKHGMKTTSSDSPQWQAVSCSKSESSSGLPHTHMSAALETLQENFICSFMHFTKLSWLNRGELYGNCRLWSPT